MSSNYEVVKSHNKVVVKVTVNDRVREFQFDAAVYAALESCVQPIWNGELQQKLARAMGIAAPGGKCSKAASLLERYTHGYHAFNGYCALLIGTQVGSKRFFQFNPNIIPSDESKAGMLSKTGREVGAPAPVARVREEDLDIPEDFELSESDMNDIIDQAYVLLGFNPNNLSEEAPDLTFAEAQAVLNEVQ